MTELPVWPATEAVETIEPPLPSAISRLATHCVAKKGTFTFTSMVKSYRSGVSSK